MPTLRHPSWFVTFLACVLFGWTYAPVGLVEGQPVPKAAGGGPPPGCVEDGGFDDVLDRWGCCSGVVVVGSVVCLRPEDRGGTWDRCIQICGSRLVGGCVPRGGFDDILEGTRCCSHRSVPGSVRCLDPGDYGTTWRSCVHRCA
jgi:hypothetical protein